MTDTLNALILGIVQGLTEFLPVSSSGHLVLFGKVLHAAEGDLLFSASVHCGTLLAVAIVFREDLARLAAQPLRALRDRRALEGPTRLFRTYPSVRLMLLIVAASIPTAIIGLTFREGFERMFTSLPVVGVALCVTGTLLVATRFARIGSLDSLNMPIVAALAIGVAQGMAITPGVSRSGTTICVALLCGADREFAGRFSFLLSIPAILGAELLGLRNSTGSFDAAALSTLAVGFTSAAVVGYVALRVLLAFVRRGKIHYFATYCFAVGAGVLIYTFLL